MNFRSVHTVENYVQYLTEAFLIYYIERFSFKLKNQIRSPRKVYSYDTGTINAIKFKTTHDMGKLIENLVAVELLRRESEFYYYKTIGGKEVDFVVKEGLKVGQLIQVCYDVEHPLTKKRELNALVKAAKEIRCENLMILTWDHEAEERFSGRSITFLPLWKWLIGLENKIIM